MNDTLSPELLSSEAKKLYQKGEYIEASHSFKAAAQGYLSTGDVLNAAEMANNQSVALLKANNPQGAYEAVYGTDATFAAIGDMKRQAMALGNLGAALEKLNRIEEAIVAYEQSAELFKQIGEHDLRAPVLQSLSALQLRTGRQLESMATMNAGLGEYKQPSLPQRVLKKLLQIPFRFIFRS